MSESQIEEYEVLQNWKFLRTLAQGGILEYGEFVNAALYNEKFGYYKKDKTRVGKDGADFYTAQSLPRGIFKKLLNACALKILSENFDVEIEDEGKIKNFEFCEIGCENLNQRLFESGKIFGINDELRLEGNLAAVSNELLDARPFSRFKFSNNAWKKVFLKFPKDGEEIIFDENLTPKNVEKILLDASESETKILNKNFKDAEIENFNVELSPDAEALFKKICASQWKGVLIFCDYFRTRDELCRIPNGTSRGYFKHRYTPSTLSKAGFADISYSPCSDIFEDIAKSHGLENVCTLRQEQFFMTHAQGEIMRIISSNSNPLDPDKRELSEIINPAMMGSNFRVLSAIKR